MRELTHHSIGIHKTWHQDEHDRIKVTRYVLRKGDSSKTTVVVTLGTGGAIESLCDLLRDGHVITAIHYDETPP